MEYLTQTIKEARDYQLQICAGRMKELKADATDNLTSFIANNVYHACNQELHNRNLDTI